MPAQLVALTEGPNILLDKPILLLGRHPECDIQIDSRKISRRHCCLAQVDDYLVVRDLGSTNGIRINGVRVLEGRLRAKDELTIGNTRYQPCWDSADIRNDVVDRRAREPVVRSVPNLDDADDHMLESCDEPVPLKDPNNQANLAPSGRPAPGGVAPPAEDSVPSPNPAGDESFILP